MDVIPAVDIMGGRVVRLRQGRPGTETVYSDDPVGTARDLVASGARRLHVVDLDRALSTGADNRSLVWEIVRSVAVPVQVGGGLRSEDDIEEAWSHGANGAVISTSLFEGRGAALTTRYRPECRSGRLIPSLDMKNGEVAVSGWSASAGLGLKAALSMLAGWGFARIIYTDTGRDGLLTGPDHPSSLLEWGLEVVIAGGVRNLDDIFALRQAGFHGAIVGRAVYDGTVDLRQAAGMGEGGSGGS